MSDTITTYDGMLKQYYDDNKVQNLIYDKNPFLTMCPKNEGFVGDAYKVPVIFGGGQGIGKTFSNAQSQASNTSQQIAAFLVSSRAPFYGFTNWTRETMLASANDVGAFMSVAKVAVENCLRGMGNRLATAFYRSGYGEMANLSSTVSVTGATSITLNNVDDIVNFEVGQMLDCSATLTGAPKSVGSSGNGLIVTSVDRSNGKLGFGYAIDDATNGIPTIAAGDFLFVRGDHSTSTTLPIGLEGWIPATAPSPSATLWGQTLTDTRLYGQRLDARDGRPLEEALIEAAQIVAREGGQLSHFFMGFNAYARLLKGMQGRVILTDVETDTGIGFRGATVQTPAGEVLVVPDRTCPANRIFGLQLDTWEIASLGKLVAPVEEDGLMILRSASADSFESRYASYSQLVCKAPGKNINIQISTS